MTIMGENGVIGSSGKWYECKSQCHFPTIMIIASQNPDEQPFVLCRNDQLAWSAVPPNRAQFETVMEWCTKRELIFEDITTGGEWDKWISN